MDFRNIKNKRWYPNTVALCLAILFYFILNNIGILGEFLKGLWDLLLPVLLGVIFAYMIDPIARLLQNRLFPMFNRIHPGRKSAVLSAFVLVLLAVVLFFSLVIPATFSSLSILLSNLDSYEDVLIRFFSVLGFDSTSVKPEIDSLFLQFKDMFPSLTQQIVIRSAGTLSALLNIGIGFVLAVYILLDKEKILMWVNRILQALIPPEYYPGFQNYMSRCNDILLRYLSCSLLEALLVGTTNAIFMFLFRIPMVGLISVLVGVTNLAPDFGPLFGGAVGTFILFLMKPSYGILFLIFTILIQTIDSYVIKPLLFGETFGVSALWILIAIIWGGKMFGIIGLLLAIPFAAIVQYTLEDILFPKAKEEGLIPQNPNE